MRERGRRLVWGCEEGETWCYRKEKELEISDRISFRPIYPYYFPFPTPEPLSVFDQHAPYANSTNISGRPHHAQPHLTPPVPKLPSKSPHQQPNPPHRPSPSYEQTFQTAALQCSNPTATSPSQPHHTTRSDMYTQDAAITLRHPNLGPKVPTQHPPPPTSLVNAPPPPAGHPARQTGSVRLSGCEEGCRAAWWDGVRGLGC